MVFEALIEKQKQLKKQLAKLKAFFNYSKKFCDRKIKLIDTFWAHSAHLRYFSNAVVETKRSWLRFFRRKKVLERRIFFEGKAKETYDEINRMFNALLDIIARQLRVLDIDIEESYDDAARIQNLINSAVIARLDQDSKATAEIIISRQKQTIADLLKIIIARRKSLHNEKAIIEQIIRAANADIGFLGPNYVGGGAISLLSDLKETIHAEARDYETLPPMIDSLLNETEEIMEGSRAVLGTYPKPILTTLPEEILELIKKEKDKVAVIQQYMEAQRSFRNGINPRTLIAVHLTRYLPEKGYIRTMGQMQEINERLNFPRETIHFSLNGPVTDIPFGGSWSDTKYAILIPMEKVFDRFINLSPQDAFVFGQLEIPKGSWFMVPHPNQGQSRESLVLFYKEHAPNAEIDFREEGEDIREHAYRVIAAMGYSPMEMGMHMWARPATANASAAIRALLQNRPGAVFSDSYKRFADEMQKEVILHQNTFWANIENLVAVRVINRLNKEEHLQKFRGDDGTLRLNRLKEDIESIKNSIMNVYRELREKCKHMKNRDELQAYLRIANFLKESYAIIDKLYKPYFA